MEYFKRNHVGPAVEVNLQGASCEAFIKKNSAKLAGKILADYRDEKLLNLAHINKSGACIMLLSLTPDMEEASFKTWLSDFREYFYFQGKYHINQNERPNDYTIEYISCSFNDFIIEAVRALRAGCNPEFGSQRNQLSEKDIAMDSFVKTKSGLYIKKS